VANLAAALKAAPAGEQPGPAAAALAVLGALAVDAEGRESILAAGAVASAVRLLRAPAPDLVRGPARAEHASEVYAGLLRAPAPDLVCGPTRTGHASEAWGPGAGPAGTVVASAAAACRHAGAGSRLCARQACARRTPLAARAGPTCTC